MPKTKVKSPTHFTQSRMDKVLRIFLGEGKFALSNGIVSTEELNGCIKFLKQQPKELNTRNSKILLKNITFDIGPASPEWLRSHRDEKIFELINEIFDFSSRWSVIALDNITILQEGNRYPLSSFCLLEFLTPFTPSNYEKPRVSLPSS